MRARKNDRYVQVLRRVHLFAHAYVYAVKYIINEKLVCKTNVQLTQCNMHISCGILVFIRNTTSLFTVRIIFRPPYRSERDPRTVTRVKKLNNHCDRLHRCRCPPVLLATCAGFTSKTRYCYRKIPRITVVSSVFCVRDQTA